MFKRALVNNRIWAKEVRVIDETGKNLGVLKLNEALQIARERNLDLIQITEKLDTPVCKIMDYGKYEYSEKKQEKKSAQKQKSGEMKGIKLGFNISPHDLEIRAKQAEKFLKQGNRVRIEMRLRGREKALQGFAREKINKFTETLGNLIPYKIEKELKKEPRGLTMIIAKQ
ncbi:translation initiation factor IF-3 [Candidatus Parcubacteria bacterium]|nr:translation initiation factor IF-3 [Candidatus Parcubacteria bacterium]